MPSMMKKIIWNGDFRGLAVVSPVAFPVTHPESSYK